LEKKLINEMQTKVDIKHFSKVDQDKKVNWPSYLVYLQCEYIKSSTKTHHKNVIHLILLLEQPKK
jgi:hypothetical protein